MEEHIIYKAMQMFEEKTGLKARWYANVDDKIFDGHIELKGGNTKYKMPAIFKRDVKNINLMQFQQFKEDFGEFMIIGGIIYPGIRQQLRAMDMNYIDAAGNCNIRKNDWIFLVEGFKNDIQIIAKKDRAFTKTGLMLIFHFLNDEKYLNATYRQMAEDYGIAIGNITKIITALKEHGHLILYDKKQLRLIKKKELLDEWIMAYEQKLKPTLEIGQFRFINGQDKDWKRIHIKTEEVQWGAEPAAELLTGYLKAATLTFYTIETKVNLMRKYKLAPDPKGNLKILKKFWKFNNPLEDTVPPLLVYADLVNTGDPRNIDTARKLYDGLLKEKF